MIIRCSSFRVVALDLDTVSPQYRIHWVRECHIVVVGGVMEGGGREGEREARNRRKKSMEWTQLLNNLFQRKEGRMKKDDQGSFQGRQQL